MTVAELLAAVRRLLRAGEALNARFADELSRVLRQAERRMLPVLIDALNDRGSARAFEAARLVAIRDGLREALTAGGYDELILDYTGTRLEAVAKRVAATVRVDAEFVPDVAQMVRALQGVLRLDLLSQGDEITRTVMRAVMRNVIGGVDTNTAIADLAKQLDLTYAQTRTLYDTSVSTYQRQVAAAQSPDDGAAAYVYTGPVDGKMRPFCRDLVGRVLTRDAIDDLDNGQTANVYLTGGGYNCRHMWTWTAGISELDALADTGMRVPEVQHALRFVTKVKRAA